MFGFWFSIAGLFFGTVCSLMAKEKGRDQKNWFILGFTGSIFSYILLSNLSSLTSSDLSLSEEKEEFCAEVY